MDPACTESTLIVSIARLFVSHSWLSMDKRLKEMRLSKTWTALKTLPWACPEMLIFVMLGRAVCSCSLTLSETTSASECGRMCVHGTALHGRLCGPHKTHQGHVCLHASERSFAQRKQRWRPGWQAGLGRPQSCAAASRSAEQQAYSRADLAKQMLAFGLPTLSISLADPAMSLVDTVIIGALFSAWPACVMRREALPLNSKHTQASTHPRWSLRRWAQMWWFSTFSSMCFALVFPFQQSGTCLRRVPQTVFALRFNTIYCLVSTRHAMCCSLSCATLLMTKFQTVSSAKAGYTFFSFCLAD